MTKPWMRHVIAFAALAFLVSACGSFKPNESGEFSRADDIPPGPGLFTGEKGKWVVYEK
jgi:hypothetical protein